MNMKNSIFLLVLSIFLIGCSNPIIVDNNTKNNTQTTKDTTTDIEEPNYNLNFGLYIASSELEERIQSNKSLWNDNSKIVGYYPIYTPGIDTVSHYEFKVKTDNKDAGYILVSVTENDIQIPELAEEGLTTTEKYRNALNTSDFKVIRFNWFESAAESNVIARGENSTVLATIGMNGAGLNIINNTRSIENTFEKDYNKIKEMLSNKVKEDGCLPLYKKETLEAYYKVKDNSIVNTRGDVSTPYKVTDQIELKNTFRYKYQSNIMRTIKLDNNGGYGNITLRVTYYDDTYEDISMALYYNYQATLKRDDVKRIECKDIYYYSSVSSQIKIMYGEEEVIILNTYFTNYYKNTTLWNKGEWAETKLDGWHLPRWYQPWNTDGNLVVGCGNVAWAMVYAYWHQFRGKKNLFKDINNNPVNISNIADMNGCERDKPAYTTYNGLIYDTMWNQLYWMTGSSRWGSTNGSWSPPWDNGSGRDMTDGNTYGYSKGYQVNVNHKDGWYINDIYNNVACDNPVILLVYSECKIGLADHYVVTEGAMRKYWSNNPSYCYEGAYYCNWGWGTRSERKWIFICYEEQAAEAFVGPFAGKQICSIYDSYMITID